jgi:Ca2+-dependent lipid-binding protein
MEVQKGSTNPNEVLKAPDQVEVQENSEIESKLKSQKIDSRRYDSLDPSNSTTQSQYSQPNTTRIGRFNASSGGPPKVPLPNPAETGKAQRSGQNLGANVASVSNNVAGGADFVASNVGQLTKNSGVNDSIRTVNDNIGKANTVINNNINTVNNAIGSLNAKNGAERDETVGSVNRQAQNANTKINENVSAINNQVNSVNSKINDSFGSSKHSLSSGNANSTNNNGIQSVNNKVKNVNTEVNKTLSDLNNKLDNAGMRKDVPSSQPHSQQSSLKAPAPISSSQVGSKNASSSNVSVPSYGMKDSSSVPSSVGSQARRGISSRNEGPDVPEKDFVPVQPVGVKGSVDNTVITPIQSNKAGISSVQSTPSKIQPGKPSGTNAKLVPSEDLDMTNIKTKPPPRQPGQPTFRGWKEVGGWEEQDMLTMEDETVDLLSRTSVYDAYLPPAAIGDWYHNVGYLIGAGLLSWIVGWFKFTLAPVFVIMIVFSLLYRASIRKYRALVREQVQREFSIKTIESDYETMDWLNNFLEKFWVFLEPSISQIVCDQANPILASSPAPAFIKKLWIDSFSAGTKPPRIEQVKTLQGTNDDIVVMDWGFSFTPNAIVDANNKQLKNKVNQKVVVKASLFGITIPVTVSDVSCLGMLRVRMRMMTSFPHIETINVSFLEPPVFDFNTRLLGETAFNWEVLVFPGLYPFINEMIKKYVGPIVFSPLSFQLNVQQLLAGNALDSAIGVLAITAKSARGLKGFSTIGNTLDPYLTYSFGNGEVLGKTSTKDDTSSPTWNETVYVPIKSLAVPLDIAGIDFNDFRKDRQFGSIKLDLESLIENPIQSNISQPFLRNNRPVGELQFGLHFMPTLEPIRQADGAVTPPPDLNTGIARICVAEARHLNPGSEKAASTYVEVYIDGKLVKKSSVQKKTNTPGWNCVIENIVNNRAKSKVKIVVKNKEDKIIGHIYKSLNELVDATQVDQTWFPLGKGGEARIETSWKPVELTNVSGSAGYTQPIGAIRVSILNGKDLRNLETIGKVDPYVRLFVNGVEKSRTVAIEADLNPTWNEVHYVTVSSANQKLTIEVMDVEAHSPDRTLGSFDVKLSDIINKDETGNYIEHSDLKERTSTLIHKKGPKGTVTYSLSFFPVVPVMTIEEIKEEEEEKLKIEEEKKKQAQEAAAEAKNGGEASKDSKDDKKPISEEENLEDDLASSKARLSLQELVEYKSGVFTYELIDAVVPKDDVYIQLFFDSYGYPGFVSPKITKKGPNKIALSGDGVVKELDRSNVLIRLVSKKGYNRAEKCISEISIPTLQLLESAFEKPQTITLTGAYETKVNLQVGWVPVLYEHGIPPQDSADNSGILTVNIEKAEDLPSSDSNGYSDPYIELFVNTDSKPAYKTKKKKKTLNPTFNELATIELYNMYDSVIKVVCTDWDMAGDNELLGIGYIKLSEFSEENTEFKVPLVGDNGESAGFAYFSLSFEPQFLLNISSESDKVIDPLGAVGAVGSTGKNAVKSVGKLGLGGVGKGASFLKGLGHHKD